MKKITLFDNKAKAIHGLLAIFFGVIVVSYPGLTVSLLATFFGLLLLIGGAILGISAYMKKDLKRTGMLDFILGIISVLLAILILSYPAQSVAAFLFLSIGVWAVITGAILIWAYIYQVNDKKSRLVTLFFGVVSLTFGLFMALWPMESTYGVTVFVGIYAILYGIHALFFSGRKN